MSLIPTFDRCSNCCMPVSYPGLSFNEDGICALCTDFISDPPQYKGKDKLVEDISKLLDHAKQDREYDCIIGYSGGRDSTYLLYYLKEILNLRILAVTMTNNFMPEETLNNLQRITDKLGIKNLCIQNESLNKHSIESVRAWSHRPTAAMLATFCVGCRYGIRRMIPKYALMNGIPIVFSGDTPVEEFTSNGNAKSMNYRTAILDKHPDSPSALGKMAGYAGQILHNPSYLTRPRNLIMHGKEFLSSNAGGSGNNDVNVIKVFCEYVEWNEAEVNEVVKNLGWNYNHDFPAIWRSDCYINPLRQYYYKRLLGYNDTDYIVSSKVRCGKLNREDAIKMISEEGDFSEDFIRGILMKYYNLDFDRIEKAIESHIYK